MDISHVLINTNNLKKLIQIYFVKYFFCMIYMIKIKRSSESTYFVNFLNLVNNYNNTNSYEKNYNCHKCVLFLLCNTFI